MASRIEHGWLGSGLATPHTWLWLEGEIGLGMTVGSFFASLSARHPELHNLLLDPSGQNLSDDLIVVLNDDVLELARECAPLKDGDVLTLILAYAGG